MMKNNDENSLIPKVPGYVKYIGWLAILFVIIVIAIVLKYLNPKIHILNFILQYLT